MAQEEEREQKNPYFDSRSKVRSPAEQTLPENREEKQQKSQPKVEIQTTRTPVFDITTGYFLCTQTRRKPGNRETQSPKAESGR